MNEEQARARIEELKGFYGHLASYVAVNLFLFGINAMTGGPWWFFWPLMGWGIGVVAHAVQTLGVGGDWEERKLQELTGLHVTRDELVRLSERTDNLVTILSNINWESVDPELIGSRERLKDTQARLARLQDRTGAVHDDSTTRADEEAAVASELEKLEAFVTGPKFRFLEQAAQPARRP
ncbi:MAG: 2TM domain-containing protein [Pseudomonadota bacterium]